MGTVLKIIQHFIISEIQIRNKILTDFAEGVWLKWVVYIITLILVLLPFILKYIEVKVMVYITLFLENLSHPYCWYFKFYVYSTLKKVTDHLLTVFFFSLISIIY